MKNYVLGLGLAGSLLLAGALGWGIAQTGADSIARGAAPTTVERTAPAASPSAGPQHGISVRGKWHIEVRNADGTVAHSRRFENAYMDTDNLLARSLAGDVSVGDLSIRLSAAGGDSANMPCLASGTPGSCTIQKPEYPALPAKSNNLAVTIGTKSIDLSGSVEANRTGHVLHVSVKLDVCEATVAPADCGPDNLLSLSQYFTTHIFDEGIPVQEGQEIVAQVQLLFAAAQ